MLRKLPGYFLLSIVSFIFFTAVFHAIANAQETSGQQLSMQSDTAPIAQTLPPTPTIYTVPQTTNSQINVQQPTIPSPTPTIFIAPAQSTTNKMTDQASTPTPTITTTTTPSPLVQPSTSPTPTITATPSLSPTPTTQPTQTVTTTTDLETLFSTYSTMYNVSEDELKKIANCESGFNTNADTGLYAGMFQFSSSTWEAERAAMGLDTNPDLRKNAGEAIRTTAFMLSRGEQNAWPNCH